MVATYRKEHKGNIPLILLLRLQFSSFPEFYRKNFSCVAIYKKKKESFRRH